MNMNREQKKTAPRATTPETEKTNKILSINSILKKNKDVKVVIKRPGEIPQIIGAYDIPPEFLSKKLRCEARCSRGFVFTLVYDPKSCDRMNISFAREIYRGTVLIVNVAFNKLFEMSDHNLNDAFVWLMRHRV